MAEPSSSGRPHDGAPAGGRVTGPATYTILLRDFTASVRLSGTRLRRQARLGLELTVNHPGPGFPDDIAAVMSYEDIINGLRRLCAVQTFVGADDLAGQAASLCMTGPKMRRARVTADIEPLRPEDPVEGASVERAWPLGS
jgi:dihydroneopterin aldolase